jgi:nitroreductase
MKDNIFSGVMTAQNSTLTWRYATKLFDTKKKISESNLSDLKAALLFSPSSYGLQPWKFILITDSELRKKLREAAWNQPQVTDASHLIVLCVKTDVDEHHIKKYIDAIAQTRSVAKESLQEFESHILDSLKKKTATERIEWSRRQVYIALGFLLHAAAEKKIDACPMEGFDKEKFDEILGLQKEHLASVLLCPVGYRSSDDKYAHLKKVRFEEKDVFMER